MKIAIYGDSYAAPSPHNDFIDAVYQDRNSWTYPLTDKFTVENFARAGTCTWFSFEKFMQTYQDFDAIIFAWTDYTRVFVDSPFSGYSATLSHPAALKGYLEFSRNNKEDEMKKRVYEFLHTSFQVFPFLYSEPQQRYLAQKCFLDVQQLCKQHNKRIINICTFEGHDSIPNIIDPELRAGPMLTALQKVSDRETLIKNRTGPFFDNRSNHLFPCNNMALYELVLERLLDDTINDVYNCQTSDRFQYREEDWYATFSA